MTDDEAAAVALAFAALRAQSAGARAPTRSEDRWSARSARELDAFDRAAPRDGLTPWLAAARSDAIRSDVR